jgi:hypothetical protein
MLYEKGSESSLPLLLEADPIKLMITNGTHHNNVNNDPLHLNK